MYIIVIFLVSKTTQILLGYKVDVIILYQINDLLRRYDKIEFIHSFFCYLAINFMTFSFAIVN